jgi:hypothetical protein
MGVVEHEEFWEGGKREVETRKAESRGGRSRVRSLIDRLAGGFWRGKMKPETFTYPRSRPCRHTARWPFLLLGLGWATRRGEIVVREGSAWHVEE